MQKYKYKEYFIKNKMSEFDSGLCEIKIDNSV